MASPMRMFQANCEPSALRAVVLVLTDSASRCSSGSAAKTSGRLRLPSFLTGAERLFWNRLPNSMGVILAMDSGSQEGCKDWGDEIGWPGVLSLQRFIRYRVALRRNSAGCSPLHLLASVIQAQNWRSDPRRGNRLPKTDYQRPSSPSVRPCTTTPPTVLSEPEGGVACTSVWPESWLVGWARPVSQSAR